MSALLNALEICWGDVGLMLSVPFQGLGNAAIAGVATDEQLAASARCGPRWPSPSRASVPTRPPCRPPPSLDGDEYVINGEKIFVTAG